MLRATIIVLSCLLILFTSSATAEVIGWWRFEEGSGDEVEDSSGNELHGTIQEGKVGWEKVDIPPVDTAGTCAGEFDGATSLVVQSNPLLNCPQITIEAWVKHKESGTYHPLVFRTSSYVIEASVAKDGNATSYIYIGGQVVRTNVAAGFPKNEWAHVAVTYDGEVFTFWVNGEAIDEVEEKGEIDQTSSVLYIGGRVGATPERHFIGLIDEVRISNEALTPEEFLFRDAAVSPQSKLGTTWGRIKVRY